MDNVSDVNPLPPNSQNETPSLIPLMDPSNVNPLPPESFSGKIEPTPKASNDLLVPAIGYLPIGFQLIIGVIGLIGQNPKAKYHGAQSILYWLTIGMLYIPFSILATLLGVLGGAMGGLIGLVVMGVYFLAGIFIIPIFLAYKTFKGEDVVLPIIGNFVSEKIGYNPV